MESNPTLNSQPSTVAGTVNKQSSFLVILLSSLLIMACLIAGFFAWKTQQLVKELRTMNNDLKSTPIATATSTSDPTANWKTYTNSKYGFSIKYPQADEYSSKFNKFTDDLLEINGLDFLVIKIEPIKTTEKDPEVWWSKQKVDPFLNRATNCYDKNITKSIPSRYIGTLDNATNPVVNFDTNVILLRQTNKIICNEPPFNQIILLSTKDGGILSIQEGYSSVGEQILSTFKFTGPEASSSPLPVACTMDAKICPDGSAVGRSGPKCEFAACPTTSPLP